MLTDEALDVLFRQARTYAAWQDRPVGDETLRQVYELMKWGPTSANSNPARMLFLRTPEAKARSRPALAPANVAKVMTAPVTAIVAYDFQFYGKLPRLFPHNPAMRDRFAGAPELVRGHGPAQFEPSGRIPDRRGARARARLRTALGIRQRQGG